MKKGVKIALIIAATFIILLVVSTLLNNKRTEEKTPKNAEYTTESTTEHGIVSKQGLQSDLDSVGDDGVPLWRDGRVRDSADSEVDIEELKKIDGIVSEGNDKK